MDEIKIDERMTVIVPDTQEKASQSQGIDVAPRPYGMALGFVVAPADGETWPVWVACRDAWLTAKERKSGRTNTRKAYLRDWSSFFDFMKLTPPWIRPVNPWEVGGVHVQTWVEYLEQREFSQATINRMLAALSSFYDFAQTRYTLQNRDGTIPLWDKGNPFHLVERFKVSPYGRAKYPTLDEVQRLFGAIHLNTRSGWRDMALLLGIFVTTRRSEEWLELKWGDIHESTDGGRFFEYRCKGGKTKKQEMPLDVYRVICTYLQNAGRWPLKAEDYVFVALSDKARRLRRADGSSIVGEEYRPDGQPLTNHVVNGMLKRYGHRAQISEEKLHIHGLRHAGARARRKRGADVVEIKDILGHANIAITQVYIDEILDDPKDQTADGVFADYAPRQLKLALNVVDPHL